MSAGGKIIIKNTSCALCGVWCSISQPISDFPGNQYESATFRPKTQLVTVATEIA